MEEGGRGLILVSARPGAEDRVLADLMDAVFPHDPSARAYKTRYRGLLVLTTEKNPTDLVNLLVRLYPVRGVHSYRPLLVWELSDKPSEKALELLEKAVEKGAKCEKLRVSVRGARVDKDGLWRKAVKLLRERNKKCVLSIEIIENLVGVSLIIRPHMTEG